MKFFTYLSVAHLKYPLTFSLVLIISQPQIFRDLQNSWTPIQLDISLLSEVVNTDGVVKNLVQCLF